MYHTNPPGSRTRNSRISIKKRKKNIFINKKLQLRLLEVWSGASQRGAMVIERLDGVNSVHRKIQWKYKPK